jgi:hypothetical protein
MARIDGVDPSLTSGYMKDVFVAQTKVYGAPLLNHLLYARRPTVFRAVRAMWTGIEASGLIDSRLQALINRRVAALNNCEF